MVPLPLVVTFPSSHYNPPPPAATTMTIHLPYGFDNFTTTMLNGTSMTIPPAHPLVGIGGRHTMPPELIIAMLALLMMVPSTLADLCHLIWYVRVFGVVSLLGKRSSGDSGDHVDEGPDCARRKVPSCHCQCGRRQSLPPSYSRHSLSETLCETRDVSGDDADVDENGEGHKKDDGRKDDKVCEGDMEEFNLGAFKSLYPDEAAEKEYIDNDKPDR